MLIRIEPLTRETFALFGDVIDDVGPVTFSTNACTATRIDELGVADCNAECGKTLFSIIRTARTTTPKALTLMERHPISSQAFVPLGGERTITVVAPQERRPKAGGLRAFVSNDRQGLNYHRGSRYHPLISNDAGNFLIVDQAEPGPGFEQDYEEVALEPGARLDAAGVSEHQLVISNSSGSERS